MVLEKIFLIGQSQRTAYGGHGNFVQANNFRGDFLTDQNKMSNPNTGPSIHASFQVSTDCLAVSEKIF